MFVHDDRSQVQAFLRPFQKNLALYFDIKGSKSCYLNVFRLFSSPYLIFVHELGHLVAARRKGIATSPAVFIPFVGAVIAMKERPPDAKTEAYLAYGGPLFGLLSFLPAIPLYLWTGEPIFALLIFLGAMLNLFNLFPVSPLDGGRIVSVLSTKIWLFGLLLMVPVLFLSPDPLLLLIFIFGAVTWWNRAREGFAGKVLEAKETLQRRYISELEQFADELFYSVENEWGEREPVLNSEMCLFKAREIKNRKQELRTKIAQEPRAIPFLQDERKLKKEKLKLAYKYEEKKETILDVIDNEEWLQTEIAKERKVLKEIRKEAARLKTYYEASAKTRWTVLALYLALTIVLSVFFIYAMQIMATHPELAQYAAA